jgi:formate hydrogenlyase subunit 3/multisubunit Na+/H+ antiporter MnhD subunit
LGLYLPERERVKLLVEAIGWASAVTILIAYLLLSMGKLSGKSPSYQWMNVVGASGFVLNSGYNGALPSAALNVIWVAIGVFALAKIRSARAART